MTTFTLKIKENVDVDYVRQLKLSNTLDNGLLFLKGHTNVKIIK